MADHYRELIDAFLEQVAHDPIFRQQVRDDPQAALEASGFGRAIQEMKPDVWESAEVMGFGCEDTCFNLWTCLSNSCYVTI
jgi:hypothetical protein